MVEALAHYTQNCNKCSNHFLDSTPSFTTATIFSTVLYMDYDFHNDFCGKISSVSCVRAMALTPKKDFQLFKRPVHNMITP